jgi:hypothetical protein
MHVQKIIQVTRRFVYILSLGSLIAALALL